MRPHTHTHRLRETDMLLGGQGFSCRYMIFEVEMLSVVHGEI